jgi:hypothetical protein
VEVGTEKLCTLDSDDQFGAFLSKLFDSKISDRNNIVTRKYTKPNSSAEGNFSLVVTDKSNASTKKEYQIKLPHELQQLGKMDRSLNFKIHERFFLAVWGELNSDSPTHAENSLT